MRTLKAELKSNACSVLESRVVRAVDLLRQQETVKLDVIASHVGLSTSRLSHLFTAHVGRAPVSYRKWQRLRVAAELLGQVSELWTLHWGRASVIQRT